MDEGIREVSKREMRAMFQTKPTPTPTQQARFIAQHMARWSFLYAPDPLFATVITYGIEQLERWYAEQQGPDAAQRVTRTVVGKLNEAFAKRSVPYRVDDDFEVRWYGDESTYKAITEPALKVLGDPRLAGAKTEYEDALAGLRTGKQKSLEDAIEESTKAVESTMKVLIDETGLNRTGKETADPLIKILAAGKVVPAHVDQLLFAAARIRNAAGGHGAGGTPRHTPEDLAVACVAASGVAITYLGGKFP
jgi:hypothetical protein